MDKHSISCSVPEDLVERVGSEATSDLPHATPKTCHGSAHSLEVGARAGKQMYCYCLHPALRCVRLALGPPTLSPLILGAPPAVVVPPLRSVCTRACILSRRNAALLCGAYALARPRAALLPSAALCRRAASTLAVLGRSRDLTSLAGPRARSMGRTRALRGALMCCTDAASPLLRTTGASGAAAGRPSTLQALEHALVLALSRPGLARPSRTRCPRFLSTTLIVPVSSAGGYIRVRPD